MPRWFSQSEIEIIQQRLLEEGYRLFSSFGLRKTNVDELARAAGISKGAFYRFYESKEALFMDVMEAIEMRMRGQILDLIDRPGPTPRARLSALLADTFGLLREMPILKVFTAGDYDLFARRLPLNKLQEHMASDRGFLNEMVARCEQAGIPICVPPEQMMQVIYPLVLSTLRQDDIRERMTQGSTEVLLELAAAYFIGEVEIQFQPRAQRDTNIAEKDAE